MNQNNKIKCDVCGVMILPQTALEYSGKCAPCGEGRHVTSKGSITNRPSGRILDRMCMAAKLDQNAKDYVDYKFFADIWDRDPRFNSRSFKVATAIGLLRIHKNENRLEILIGIPEDKSEVIADAIFRKIIADKSNSLWPESCQLVTG